MWRSVIWPPTAEQNHQPRKRGRPTKEEAANHPAQDAQVIVAAEVSQQTTDRQQLLPMVQAVRETLGSAPETIVADAGYWDTISLRNPALEGILVLVSPDRKSTRLNSSHLGISYAVFCL